MKCYLRLTFLVYFLSPVHIISFFFFFFPCILYIQSWLLTNEFVKDWLDDHHIILCYLSPIVSARYGEKCSKDFILYKFYYLLEKDRPALFSAAHTDR